MDALLWQDKELSLLDQRKYPKETQWYDCKTLEEVLAVLARPGAVGGEEIVACSGAYAVCLTALAHEAEGDLGPHIKKAHAALLAARPNSPALRTALSQMDKAYEKYENDDQLVTALLAMAVTVHRQYVVACRTMGREGRDILPEEAKIVVLGSRGGLFHSGAPGGVVGLLRAAQMKNKVAEVFVCEGRPELDGPQLATELAAQKLPVKLMPDQAAAALMPRRSCDMVLIEGLRAAKNGDLLAPAGSYALAIAAFFHSIPVYATLFTADYDQNTETGEAFAQEDYDEAALAAWFPALPEGLSAWSPKRDVVLHQLITGLITDKGLVFPPYEETIAEALTREMNKPLLVL